MTSKKWKHDELLLDLAQHLQNPERLLWMDMQIGPAGSPRPDVYTMRKSYSKPAPIAYEIKVSVSDFRSDMTTGKWQRYLKFASAVTFCVPSGLVTKNDIPKGCGLMVRGESGWKTVKAPTLQVVHLEPYAYMKLLIDGAERANKAHRLHEFNVYMKTKELRKTLGEKVAQAVEDHERLVSDAKYKMLRAESEAKRMEVRAKRLYDEERERISSMNDAADKAINTLREVLDLPSNASSWQVLQAAEAFKQKCNADRRLPDARRALSRLSADVQKAMSHLPEETTEQCPS